MPTYNGTKVSDLDATTPTSGTWTVPEADDAIREIKTVIKNECKVTVPGAYPYTILSTDSYIHATGTVTVNFPQITAVSSATVRKEYVVANVGAGVVTMAPYAGDTLPITTLAAGALAVFWSNGGTDWYVKNNAINAGNLLADGTYRTASATPAADTVVVSNASGIVDYQSKHLAMTGEDFIASTNPTTCTITIASPAVVSAASHGRSIDDAIIFTTSGTLPTGLSLDTVYWIISSGFTTGQFQVSATKGGSAVNTSGTQSGTHYFEKWTVLDFGSVTNGDRILLSARLTITNGTPGNYTLLIQKNSGTGQVNFFNTQTDISTTSYISNPSNNSIMLNGIAKISSSGTLIIEAKMSGLYTVRHVELYAFFLKKQ